MEGDCEDGGSWSYSGVCTKVRCPTPRNITGGFTNITAGDDFEFGDEVMYR